MKKRAFTLIELLTVIAVIGILVGILLPALSKVKERAKKTQAQADISALKMAISSYKQTYGYNPASKTSVADKTIDKDSVSGNPSYDEFIGILANTKQGGREVVFLEPHSGGTFLDPWENEYKIVVDTDYSGGVTVGSDTVYGGVAIWSFGADETDDSGSDDDVTSWSN